MTPKAVVICAALALVLVSAEGSAQTTSWTTGNKLKEECNSESIFERGLCSGFATAVAGIVANEAVYGWRACIPGGVTVGQLVGITKKHLNDNPEYLHLTATSIVTSLRHP